jgi:hypothetical protein
MKLLDIIEGWDDAPDYDSGEYGFRDSSFDKQKIYMDLLVSVDDFALLRNKETNGLYITYTEDIDTDYHQGYYTYEVDSDEDGQYQYAEFSDDIEITDQTIELFTQHQIQSNSFTDDIDKFTGFNTNIVVLLITKENKKGVYEEFIDLFRAYFEEPKKSSTYTGKK